MRITDIAALNNPWIVTRLGQHLGSVKLVHGMSALKSKPYCLSRGIEKPKPHELLSAFFEVTNPITVYKKVRVTARGMLIGGVASHSGLLELVLPPGVVFHATRFSTKMRASFALVDRFPGRFFYYVPKDCIRVQSMFDSRFIYREDSCVRPRRGLSKMFEECGSGIHFFMKKHQARAY